MARVLSEYGMGKADELYAALGYGKISAKTVLAHFVPQEELKEAPRERDRARSSAACSAPAKTRSTSTGSTT